ncbi:MAG: hypothetical protein P1V81_05420 [Planctomycetota bacterium]|nr:hypothetical protein [Planctomycetota bacterium]
MAIRRPPRRKLTGAPVTLAVLLFLDAIILFAFWADPPFSDELIGQAGMVRFFLGLPSALLLIPLVLWRTRALLRQVAAGTEDLGQGRTMVELLVLMLSAMLAAVMFLG